MPSPQSARFSPSFSRSLALSNGHQFTFLALQNVIQNVARRSIVSEVTTHSRVRLSIATRSFYESFAAPRSFSPPSLSLLLSFSLSFSLLVSFLFLSRNPSRTYRFTRSVYVSIRDPAVEYLFSTIKAIPRRDTHNMLIGKRKKKKM